MMAKKRDGKSGGVDLDSIREMSNLINRLRLIARCIYGALGLTYSWLLLSGLPYSDIINGSDPSVILQVTLIIMYLSWVFGINMDFGVQALVYISAPKRGEMSKGLYFTASALFVAAMVLLAVRKNPQYFAAALTVFSLVCLWSLVAASQGARDIIEESKEIYERDSNWFGKEQLEIVEHYMTGKWLWIRQAVLLGTLVVVDVICWLDEVPRTIATWIHFWKPEYAERPVAALIPILSLIVFLAIAETWQWYMRLKAKLSVTALDILKSNYTIKRKKEQTSQITRPDIPIRATMHDKLARIRGILRRLIT